MYRTTLVLLFSLVLFKTSRAQQISPQTNAVKIAFYTLHISKDSIRQKISCIIKSVTVVDQVPKPSVSRDHSKDPDHLRILIVDKFKNKQVVFTEHPLNKQVELYDDETKEIEFKRISLTEGDVTFRIPYYTDYKKIKITEINNFKKGKTISIKHDK